MPSKQRPALVTAAFAMVFAVAATVVTAAPAETPRLRLAAPAYMLSEDNPLKEGLPYDGAVEVEVAGHAYDPPLAVPAAPRAWPPAPDAVEVDQILAHLRGELGLDNRVLVHGVAFYTDIVVAIVMIESDEWQPEPRRVFALVEVPGEGWRHSEAALSEPVIEVITEGWRESGWIEVIPSDMSLPAD